MKSKNKSKKFTPVCIDLETTGLKAVHEIVQITAITYDSNFKPKAKFKTLVRPNRINSITEEALEVNQLKLSDLMEAPTSMSVRSAFLKWIKEVIENTMHPMGFNYSFDKGFLVKFLGEDNYNSVFHYKFRDASILFEGMKEAGIYPELGSHGLVSLCQYFDIIHKPHDSYGDVMATLRLYNILVNKLKMLNEPKLDLRRRADGTFRETD